MDFVAGEDDGKPLGSFGPRESVEMRELWQNDVLVALNQQVFAILA